MTRVLCLGALLCGASGALGATLELENLEIRLNASFDNAFAFGSPDNITATVPDGEGTTQRASVVAWSTDIDGVGGNDDVVTFTVTGVSNTSNNVTWTDIGWGANGPFDGADSLTFSVSDVSVTGGTAAGAPISFDGFVGGAVGAYSGNNGELDGSVDINGIAADQVWPVAPGFQFTNVFRPLPLAATVTFDDPQISASVGFSGFLARAVSLEFTTIPEPSSFAMVGMAGLAVVSRRR